MTEEDAEMRWFAAALGRDQAWGAVIDCSARVRASLSP
jgi:hypothetical protein